MKFTLGMVAGRSGGDEGIRRLFRKNLVDRIDRAADGAQRRFEAPGRHRGVGVDPHQAFLRRRVADLLDIIHGMAQRDRLQRRERCLGARQRLELLGFERADDGAQPIRPLGMAGRSYVFKAGRVGDEERRHRMFDFGPGPHLSQRGRPGKVAGSRFEPRRSGQRQRTVEDSDAIQRPAPSHGDFRRHQGQSRLLHRRAWIAAGQEVDQPGRREGLSSLLRRRAREPGQRRHLLRLATRTGTARNRQHQPHRLAGGRCRQPVMVARASFPRRRVGRRDRGA